MKTRISILTPVHIGTGDEKRSFEYEFQNGIAYNYDIFDLLNCIPNNQLLDKRFLDSLKNNRGESSRDRMNDNLKSKIDYRKLKPLYYLTSNFSHAKSKNVSVQVKNINKPIIPGSTIKGALFNAIYYDIVKKHLDIIYQKQDFFSSNLNTEKILGIIFNEKMKEMSEFLMLWHSCIICRDIPFNNMILLQSEREKIDKTKKMDFSPYVECISDSQVQTDEYIIIDNNKVEFLTSNFYGKSYCNEFRSYFDKGKISQVCRSYFKDILLEEIEMDNKYGFYSSKKLKSLLLQFSRDEGINGFCIRIGKYTNYFFKTVSYCIKKDNLRFYERNFDQCFSPTPMKSGKTKTKAKADTIPVTRTTYFDDEQYYYPGVIKIEFVD